jgi:hypothetical protein
MHGYLLTAVHATTVLRPTAFVLVGESFSGPLASRTAANPAPGLVGFVLSTTFTRAPLPADGSAGAVRSSPPADTTAVVVAPRPEGYTRSPLGARCSAALGKPDRPPRPCRGCVASMCPTLSLRATSKPAVRGEPRPAADPMSIDSDGGPGCLNAARSPLSGLACFCKPPPSSALKRWQRSRYSRAPTIPSIQCSRPRLDRAVCPNIPRRLRGCSDRHLVLYNLGMNRLLC